MKRIFAKIVVAALMFSNVNGALAANITVNTLDDDGLTDADCNLREAVHSSNSNFGSADACAPGAVAAPDTVNFSVAGTIMLNSELPDIAAGEEIELQGGGTVTVQAPAGGRVAKLSANSNINGLTFLSGAKTGDGGTLYVDPSITLTMTDSTINNSTATGNGGAIYLGANSTLDATNVTIDNADATGFGGGIYAGSGATVTADNLTVTDSDANAGGGLYGDTNSDLTLNNSDFETNSSVTTGGGIHSNTELHLNNTKVKSNTGVSGAGIRAAGTAEIINGSLIDANTATGSGGGIFLDANTVLDIQNSSVTNNIAVNDGGGIYMGLGGIMTAITMTATSNSVTDPAGRGGGIFLDTNSDATITNSLFNLNTSAGEGGGAFFRFTKTSDFSNSDFTSNTAVSGGGGIRHQQATGFINFTLTDFTSNSATGLAANGGAAFGGGLNFIQSKLESNTALGNGGGINGSVISLTDTTLRLNNATGSGGGAYITSNANITRSLFEANGSNVEGGGLWLNGGTINNTTFYGNGSLNGGGIFSDANPTTYNSITLFSNSAPLGNGGGIDKNGIFGDTITNSILSDNWGGTGMECFGNVSSLGYNLILDPTGCGITPMGTDIVGQNPLLSALVDVGAPTKVSIPTSELSPILNAGSTVLTVDQTNNLRPIGDEDDIGAYEYYDYFPAFVSEITPIVTPSANPSPTYTFNTTEAGAISFGGGCTSVTADAVVGNNTITIGPLANGTYNCTLTITNEFDAVSFPLTISSFTVGLPPSGGGSGGGGSVGVGAIGSFGRGASEGSEPVGGGTGDAVGGPDGSEIDGSEGTGGDTSSSSSGGESTNSGENNGGLHDAASEQSGQDGNVSGSSSNSGSSGAEKPTLPVAKPKPVVKSVSNLQNTRNDSTANDGNSGSANVGGEDGVDSRNLGGEGENGETNGDDSGAVDANRDGDGNVVGNEDGEKESGVRDGQNGLEDGGVEKAYTESNGDLRLGSVYAGAKSVRFGGKACLREAFEGEFSLSVVGFADSDGDGIADGLECMYGTNPLVADTDGDGWNDGEEILTYGTNALEKNAFDRGLMMAITKPFDEEKTAENKLFIKGVAPAGYEVTITAAKIIKKGEEQLIDGVKVMVGEELGPENVLGVVMADENGVFVLDSDKELKDDLYKLSASAAKVGAKRIFAYPVDVTIDQNIDIKSPTPTKIADKEINEDVVLGKLRVEIRDNKPAVVGNTDYGNKVSAVWKSVVQTNAVVSDAVSGEFAVKSPGELEVGEHSVYVWAERSSDNATSKTVRIQFEVKPWYVNNFGWIALLIGVLLAGSGVFVFRKMQNKHVEEVKPEVATEPTPPTNLNPPAAN